MTEPESSITQLAALAEPVRLALYRYVAAQPDAVSREQAAAVVGVAHHVAKFHLDRLVEEGWFTVEYRRPEGRGGPGAGRPAKLYRASGQSVEVSLPERRYQLAGAVLAAAITTAGQDGIAVSDAVRRAASAAGRQLGEEGRTAVRSSRRRPRLETACTILRDNGYEPRVERDGVVLANCPFDALARDHTDLVCGMNLDLLQGLVEGLELAGVGAVLDPAPGRCCVRLVKTK
jgi:predicted ArsR family transcriptional regulator